MNNPLLEVTHLNRHIVQNGKTVNIINDISYQFFNKIIYTIIGPSGAGKSSLLRLINRLDEPTSGDILFHGKSFGRYSPCELRRKVGYLFQSPYLFEHTVRDNLLYANKKLSDRELLFLMEEVNLKPDFLQRAINNLSEGEKQRVALARLLATKPEIILLDEPTSALDPSATQTIEQLVKDIVIREELTALVVTHHPEQALRIGQEALLLVGGKIIEAGQVEQVINNPQTKSGQLYKARELK
ncbi:MAG: ATP-binding cassette domain-containing protein [FCB group bacterium]|nr:ATP-binding cassette domain-containing protein [FCB group bacterium]